MSARIHRIVIPIRYWLLLIVLALALPARSATAAVGERAEVSQGDVPQSDESSSSIQAAPMPASDSLRGSERVEIATAAERVLSDRELVVADVAHRSVQAAALDPHVEGWCDLVQCRRTAGAQLLRYATPPPARA